jgi:hypothetical protein
MNGNDCLNFKGSLAALACEDILPAERASLAAHLAGCESCSRELEELRGVSHLLRHELGEGVPAPAGLRDRIVSAQRPSFAPVPLFRTRRAAVAAAAVFAVSALSLAGLSAANTRVASGPEGWEVQFSLLRPAAAGDAAAETSPDPAVLQRLVDERVQEQLAAALAAQQRELEARFDRTLDAERRATLADVSRTLARHERILAAGLSGDRQEMMARNQAVEKLVGNEIDRTHQMLGAVLAASRPAVVEQ